MRRAINVQVTFSHRCSSCGKTINLQVKPIELQYALLDGKLHATYMSVCPNCDFYNELEIYYGRKLE